MIPFIQPSSIATNRVLLLVAALLFSVSAWAGPGERRGCGTKTRRAEFVSKVPSDCDGNGTIISDAYRVDDIFTLKLVIHVIHKADGTGKLSEQTVRDAVRILNEDFRAIEGTSGAAGNDGGIQFVLADRDPSGNPSSGIVYVENDAYFDGELEQYGAALQWDPERYVNLYTSAGEGAGGVVYQMPWEPWAEPAFEGMVVAYDLMGRDDATGESHHVATHEMGHYLGLEHTFFGMEEGEPCITGDCNKTGDLICDTNPHPVPDLDVSSCAARTSCDAEEPVRNYMNYMPETCMTEFTLEQVNRMRCVVLNYRQKLISDDAGGGSTGNENARWIPHVTRDGGGFETSLYLTNPSTADLSYTLKVYDPAGTVIGEQEIGIPAESRSVIRPSLIANDGEPSHIAVTGATAAKVSAAYRVAGAHGVSAHVSETTIKGRGFLIHLGEADLIFDGIAMVNTGTVPVTVSATVIGDVDQSRETAVLVEDLGVLAKSLVDLSRQFPDAGNAVIRLEATGPISVTALRGSRPGSQNPFLLANPVISVE